MKETGKLSMEKLFKKLISQRLVVRMGPNLVFMEMKKQRKVCKDSLCTRQVTPTFSALEEEICFKIGQKKMSIKPLHTFRRNALFLFSVVMENSTERRNLNCALPFKKKLFAYFKYLGAGGEGRKFDFGQFASSTNFLCTNYQTFVE